MKPNRESVYTLYNERDERIAIIANRKMYRLEEMDDEQMAETFNGGDALPLITVGA